MQNPIPDLEFHDRSREFCDILVGADGINSPVRKQKLLELQIFDYGVTLINAGVAVPKMKVDDNDPVSVVEHVKRMILRFLILIIRDLASKTTPDPEKYPFKTYNPVQRRDINPLSVNVWKRMKNALKDAEIPSQALINYSSENYIFCIKEYKYETLR
ncbi:hypothetical protein GLOIN_2v1779025 [Rhizophagus irregularis DAOM 181602=DAOM 197198]|uniref:FAD-binding domain-containing protein n=1 Tax=Rhizophagus irregularis (strain DAOM 181602 / DAOM 197198 / MUCL 43194) TaxID=747089 RepID=A0A2P4PQW9_RHIID|nr:hypothetical protein GLOIN_2v1779025 [Rhizophagus irregularis DAOM 181602=DAOM 197198]POG67760.1 hypothetical protein GLOIN_2v1779025 [Rhizophagus irregularis DAOM 181602=DAOM 197198]|eukprot:XP_025174626.1 hypothetical protein GLOIN_2v1779025 [Rhizophagus irregularis DAOM 181602=DAOM 197198]